MTQASAGRERLAALLEADRDPILAACTHSLEVLDSPMVGDPGSRHQVALAAEQTLTDLVRSLRAGDVVVHQGYRPLARDPEGAHDARVAHPRGSLEAAASAFFEVMLTVLARHLRPDEERLELFNLALLALNQSINRGIGEAASTYSGYLLSRVHKAHTEERHRIARELHDRIGRRLSAAHHQLELYHRSMGSDPATARSRVEAAQQAVRESMESLRGVIADLRLQEPMRSLKRALITFLDSTHVGDVDIRLQVNGDEHWAPPAVRDESFLVIREAVRNALDHAEPTMVLLGVDIAPHELRAWVDDDGLGMGRLQDSTPRGQGMRSMRERAALMGGTVTISTQHNRGTHVELLIPLPGHRDDAAK